MTTSCPASLAPVRPALRDPRSPRSNPPDVADIDSWRYDSTRPSRGIIAAAVLVSAALHIGLFYGFRHETKVTGPAKAESVTTIRLAIPDLKELEEPEPLPTEDMGVAVDLATLVPMQADLPQLARPSDFVQAINFTSLLEKPDFSNVAITVVPENFRGGRKLAENIGKVFNLADLDRVPEPILQHSPTYPIALRREGISGKVHVQFIVDTNGRVLDAHVIETSHTGFEEAALIAVSKWKFRPGVKVGRKVNTRMAVPIVFSIADAID